MSSIVIAVSDGKEAHTINDFISFLSRTLVVVTGKEKYRRSKTSLETQPRNTITAIISLMYA